MIRYNPYKTSLITTIFDNLRNDTGPREFLVWGGRLLGKTTVAEALKERLGKPWAPAVMLQGRPIEGAAERINLKHLEDARTIVIDDADFLFQSVAARGVLSPFLRIDWQNQQRRCIILTARSLKRLIKVASADDACSVLAMKAMRLALDPWTGAWNKTLREAIDEVTSQHDVKDADKWADWVEAQTGGHPAMVAEALRLLAEGLGEDPSMAAPDDAADDNPAGDYVKGGLLDYADTLVTLALQDYRAEEPADCLKLQAAAADVTGKMAPPLSAARTGLAYRTPQTGITLVDGLLKTTLSSVNVVERPGVRIAVRPDPADPANRGVVERLESGVVVKRAELTGSLWRVADRLAQANGELVTPASLEETFKAKPESEGARKALNSALQRLRAVLTNAGLANALQNVRGQGYRLRTDLAS